MKAKTPTVLILTTFFVLMLCGAASAGTPLQENQTGTVSGDLYVNTTDGWPSSTQGATNIITQANTLPTYTSIDSAWVYVNVYSGSGSNNWPVRTTVQLDGNGDGDYDDTGETLGVEDMNIPGSPDGTVYWLNDHCMRVYSDYQVWYNVTGLVTSNNPTLYVKTENMGGDGYDGRIKLLTLTVAYNDGDTDQVHYYVLNGQDWINSGSSSSTFNTSSFNGQVSSATLNTVALSSIDGTYTLNTSSLTGNLTETGSYYKEHQWDVTSNINTGSDTTLTYTNVGASLKLNLATLTIRGATTTPALAQFTATPTSGTAPLAVQFSDTSTNNPTSWLWEYDMGSGWTTFASGTDSAAQNPLYTFTTAGAYDIRLTATNAGGSDDETKTGYITVIANSLANTAWPKFHYDLRNTGQSPNIGPQTPNVVWTAPVSIYLSTVSMTGMSLGADGTIYLGSMDKNFYAFNPDGTVKWSYLTGGRITAIPAIASDGTIYVAGGSSTDKNLYAFNPDGTVKWKYTVGGNMLQSPAIGPDGTVYIAPRDYKVYAINPDGTLQWSSAVGGLVGSGSPAIGSDGTIYVGCLDNKLYAFNPDGTTKWTYTTGGSITSPVIGPDGTIYAGSTDSNLYALNPDGTLKRTFAASSGGFIPSIGSDGTIYVGGSSTGNQLYAYDPNGTLKWSYIVGDIIKSPYAIGSDGTVYMGSHDNKVYAINSDGTLKWSYTTGGYADYSTPAIGADGTLYIGTSENKIYAFRDVAPVADFNGTPTTGTAPLAVQFTDTSSNTPTSWLWEYDMGSGWTTFASGTDSAAQNPTYTFTIAGTYSIRLTASNVTGSDDETKTGYITVNAPVIPVADFTATQTTGTAPLQVAFTNTSTDATTYAWDFDNNGTTDSTEQNPSYTYTNAGSYTVKLTATGPGGSDEEIKTDYITVSGTPDLIASDLQMPSNPVIATAYPVSATVTNGGNGDATSFVVKLYDNNTQVAKTTLTSLASGASTPASFIWTPSTTGEHVLAVIADANNEITESNEANNLISTQTTVNPSTQPDLNVTNLQLPANPTVAINSQVTATITNQGTVDASAFVVKLYDNNTQYATINLTGLAAGTSTDVTFDWLTYTTGTHNLSIITDANQQITEYNEVNNQISQQATVNPSTQPDLTITNLQLPANPTVAISSQVTATITNLGTVDSGAFVVKLYDNNTQIAKINLTGLASGASADVTFNWLTYTTGQHNLSVIADANQQITEYNEANNQISQAVTVNPSTQPDLTITDLQLPSNPVAGTTYQITATVTNLGTVDTGAFAVKLYDNNTQLGKINITSLAAGTSTQITFNWTPTTGTHNLAIKADANNQITEYNENNNTITQQSTVT